MSLPTLKVELDDDGLLNGARLDDVPTATLDTAILEYTAPAFASDITAFVRGLSTTRGAQRELQRVEAGTATLLLNNRDGRFTPFKASSPYFPNVLPMRRIRITALFTTPFVPTDITGCVGWYDFSDTSSLFQDTARTTPITADAQIIKGVTDKSGTAHHLSEATNGPTYKTAIINALSVARFDGTNDNLTATVTADASFTVFVVAQKRSAPIGSSQAVWAADNNAQLYTNSGTSPTQYRYFQTDTQVGGTAANVSGMVLRINSAASLDAYANGGSPANLDPSDVVTTSTTRSLGNNAAAGNFGDYDVCENIVYDSALVSADLNSVGTYLAAKWGFSWTTVP